MSTADEMFPKWTFEVVDEDLPFALVFKLLSGETFYFKTESPQELYTMNAMKERTYIDLPPSGGPLICCGEMDSSLYFYSKQSAIIWTTYRFYKTIEQSGRYVLKLCRKIRSRDYIRFAVQQPYFASIDPDNKNQTKIEAFDENIPSFNLDAQETKQIKENITCDRFLVHRNRVFVYTYTNGRNADFNVLKVGRIVILDGSSLFIRWTSVFANDAIDCIYVIAPESMFVIRPDLTAEYLKNKTKQRIAGFHDGLLYITDNRQLLRTTKKYELPNALQSDVSVMNVPTMSEPLQNAQISDRDQVAISSVDSVNRREEFVSTFNVEYTVLGLLGSYGAVFRVKNETDGCEYAVKRVCKDTREGTSVYALREVRALTNLNHPNIIRYCHAWEESPPPVWQMESDIMLQNNPGISRIPAGGSGTSFLYLKMELCCSSLKNWLESHQETRDLAKMKIWFKQVVSAVAYIHEKGIMHRDLKPDNILIDNDENLKICDFGIVTDFVEGQSDTFRTQIGTPLYMAPEQRAVYNWRVDIFSLGLIYAEMCVPMQRNQLMEIFDKFRGGEGQDYIVGLPDVTSSLIASMTSVNPNYRPRCEEILKMLE